MNDMILEVEREKNSLSRIVLSSPEKKQSLPEKISIRRVKDGDNSSFLAEEQHGKKAFHKKLSSADLTSYVENAFSDHHFRQLNLFSETGEVAFRISKKGKISRTVNKKATVQTVLQGHNREKNYLIREGENVPFLVDLGVFTKDLKVVAQKYDKFRQINRFIEMMDHAFRGYDKNEISVLDFGCGKSYLTFFVYHYFAVICKKRVKIIGYDLKEDVVAHCNELAKKYGYHGLKFVVADVTKDTLSQEKIDFVISLHACDTATDYALNYALEKEVPYIFSVPCCQHEVCSSIQKGDGELDLFLSHGIFKERMCALLTDAFRTKILESEGYRVDVVEFVDFAHSPKNLMLRAKRKEKIVKKDLSPLLELEKQYGFRQTLLHLREDKE